MGLLKNSRKIQVLYEQIRELQDSGKKGVICVDEFKLSDLEYLMNKHKANLEFPDYFTPRYKLNFEINEITLKLKSVKYKIVEHFVEERV